MKKSSAQSGVQKQPPQKADTQEPIKTDYPLSEKDEIKQAEEKMRKAAKKTM